MSQGEANKLCIEAIRLIELAYSLDESGAKLRNLKKAQMMLNEIVEHHADSDLAVKLSLGLPLGELSLLKLKKDIAEASDAVDKDNAHREAQEAKIRACVTLQPLHPAAQKLREAASSYSVTSLIGLGDSINHAKKYLERINGTEDYSVTIKEAEKIAHEFAQSQGNQISWIGFIYLSLAGKVGLACEIASSVRELVKRESAYFGVICGFHERTVSQISSDDAKLFLAAYRERQQASAKMPPDYVRSLPRPIADCPNYLGCHYSEANRIHDDLIYGAKSLASKITDAEDLAVSLLQEINIAEDFSREAPTCKSGFFSKKFIVKNMEFKSEDAANAYIRDWARLAAEKKEKYVNLLVEIKTMRRDLEGLSEFTRL
ncbi:hypothetical protein [Roseomonas genomospecies 6]|uniref:hypothetical protein n=1 Tax=Roseomonas genomospecies 6 TaxID=214106 RepID=UPI0011F194C4|nr:hypothetical protein [Roseomonas genomospecies 6]